MKKILTIIAITLMSALPALASEVTGNLTSGIQTGISGLVMQAPLANPSSGTYSSSISVTLTPGAGSSEVRYTLDGSTPNCSSSTVYSSPINVSSTVTIKAVSCYPGGYTSPAGVYNYTITTSSSGGGSGGGGGGGLPPSGGGGAPQQCDADFNDDGKVDIFDLNILSNNWGSTTATATTGDANCDSKVDIFDLNILSTSWTG